MDDQDDFTCGCGGSSPRRKRFTALCVPELTSDDYRIERIDWGELFGSRENFLAGLPAVTTIKAIREQRAAVRGECTKCGRILPARSTIPGMTARRRQDAAGRVVVEHVGGEPRLWMSRFAGPSRHMLLACIVVEDAYAGSATGPR